MIYENKAQKNKIRKSNIFEDQLHQIKNPYNYKTGSVTTAQHTILECKRIFLQILLVEKRPKEHQIKDSKTYEKIDV